MNLFEPVIVQPQIPTTTKEFSNRTLEVNAPTNDFLNKLNSNAVPNARISEDADISKLPLVNALQTLSTTDILNVSGQENKPQQVPSPFAHVPMRPKDPILGVTEEFNKDTRPGKLNLGAGVFKDSNGKTKVLQCVVEAKRRMDPTVPDDYLPMGGKPEYNSAVQKLVFGADSKLIAENRIATIQTLGGTGALNIAAKFLRRFLPQETQVWISNPTWENHRNIFGDDAGFKVNDYPYYDKKRHAVNFDSMLATLITLPPNSIVVLHVCCHNPSGADLTPEQWTEVASVVKYNQLIPVLDFAYQGIGKGPEQDAAPVRFFANENIPLFVTSSFSKSLNLYGQRAGALSYVAQDSDEAEKVLSQLKYCARTAYSSPPKEGVEIAHHVLTNPELNQLWQREVEDDLRKPLVDMRHKLASAIEAKLPERDVSYIRKQQGMFVFLDLTVEQVMAMKRDHGKFFVDSGRISLSSLNDDNIDGFVDALVDVWKSDSFFSRSKL